MGSTSVPCSSPVRRSSQAYRAIGWAGLLAGSLDITVALVESHLEGRTPVHLFQGIAGGLLGMSAFQGGLATAVLGLFCHFMIATAAAAVFYVASHKLRFLVQHAIVSGLIYGVAVYVVMNFIVLPLSAYHTKLPLPPHAVDVATLMLMVGLPISLVVRKYSEMPSGYAKTQ